MSEALSMGEENEVAKQYGERARGNREGRNEQVTCKTLEKENNTMEGGLGRARLRNSWKTACKAQQ